MITLKAARTGRQHAVVQKPYRRIVACLCEQGVCEGLLLCLQGENALLHRSGCPSGSLKMNGVPTPVGVSKASRMDQAP